MDAIVLFSVLCYVQIGGMFIVHLVSCRYISYSAVALIAEINTVFLHFRKLLQMAGVSFSNLVYRINAAANLTTFVSCRFVCLVWIAYGIIVWNSRISWAYMITISSSTVVMYIINAVLFWRLLCSDVFGKRRTRPTRDTCQTPITAFRVISDSTVPVSAEDVRLACCQPADSVPNIGRCSPDGVSVTNSNRRKGSTNVLPLSKASPPFPDVADHMNLVLRSHAPSPALW